MNAYLNYWHPWPRESSMVSYLFIQTRMLYVKRNVNYTSIKKSVNVSNVTDFGQALMPKTIIILLWSSKNVNAKRILIASTQLYYFSHCVRQKIAVRLYPLVHIGIYILKYRLESEPVLCSFLDLKDTRIFTCLLFIDNLLIPDVSLYIKFSKIVKT